MTNRPPDRRRNRPSRRLEFLQATAAAETDECVVWPFAMDDRGYGVASWNGRTMLAHRAMLFLAVGPPPGPGRWEAAHRPVICHNRACVNPRHLYWATPKQNNADRWADQTIPLGEQHHMTTLTAEQVLAIYNDQRPTAAVAAEYGVSDTCIRSIRNGDTWTHMLEKRPRGKRIKLSDADVAAIRVDPRNQCQIARAYGVLPSTINKIVNGVRRTEPSPFNHMTDREAS